MKLKLTAILSLFLTISVMSTELKAQICDTVSQIANSFITDEFISDGQQYVSLLNGEEIAEFITTFYGGSTYRVSVCSGMEEGNLIFRIYDAERNLLFDNSTYTNAGWWDFSFTDTQECTIEAQLDNSALGSGCAVILIAFKE